jgi:predicted CXXCH cytochrome family protein
VTRPATNSTRSNGAAARLGPRLAAVVILAGAVAWSGCSIEKNYALLSFFFDGVPAPGAGYGVPGPGGPEPPAVLAIVSAHTAYTQERCAECHGETAAFGLVAKGFGGLGSDSCLPCHSDDLNTTLWVHGPVAQGECLWCHRAHESAYPYLLVKPSPDLCLDCHRFELTGRPQPPEHEDLKRDCLDCHVGHRAEDRYLLRPRDEWQPRPGEAGSPEPPIEPKEVGETDMDY